MTDFNVHPIWRLASELRDGTLPMDRELHEQAQRAGIPYDLKALYEIARSASGYALAPDDVVVQVFSLLAATIRPRALLDPWAGTGYLIDTVRNYAHLNSAIAIGMNDQLSRIARGLVSGVEWVISDDPLVELDKLGEFELIVSWPPFDYRRPPRLISIEDKMIVGDYGELLIAKACSQHLSTRGIGVFALPASFLFSGAQHGLRKSLAGLGLGLSAAIHIPSGYWHGTKIETYLVVLDREQHDDIFVAEINKSKDHNEVVVKNFFARTSGSALSSGYLARKTFESYRQLESRERARRMAQRMGLAAIPMTQVALEVNLTKGVDQSAFPDKDNAVYVPLIGTSRAHTSKDDLSMKAHNYAQIVLDPSEALASFVAGYFNSPIGRAALDALRRGATIAHVTKGGLQASEIFLPDLGIQTQCIQMESSTLNLISELTALRTQIWETPRKVKRIQAQIAKVNHEGTLLTWMDALPFPLASVLWTYHASGNDDKSAYEHLLHFFEALAEFHAIVLWSAMHASHALKDDQRYPLRPNRPFKSSIEKSSFGTWLELTSVLSKFGRVLLNGNQEDKGALFGAFGMRDTDVLDVLFSGGIIVQLEKANALRNRTVGHGGIVGKEEAQRRRVILESILASLRAEVGDIWSRFPLFKAGVASIKGGQYTYESERIMGRSSPFQKSHVITRNQIDHGSLFLYAADSETGVPVAPLLIIGPSPNTAQNAVYFYNRIEGERLRFVSYNFENEAEIYSADSFISATLKTIIESIG